MRKYPRQTGFIAPDSHPLGEERRSVAVAELIATIGLMLGTAVAAIVVSAGMARADVGAVMVDNDVTLFAVALLLGLIFVACGGLAIWPRRRGGHF